MNKVIAIYLVNKLTALPVSPLSGMWALEVGQPLLVLNVLPVPLLPACLPRHFGGSVEQLAID